MPVTVPLAIAIVAVIALNAVFAFVQELQAGRAAEALPTIAWRWRSGCGGWRGGRRW